MKHLYPHNFKLWITLFLFALLSACAPPKPGVYKDDQISSSKRADFHKLNDEALAQIKGGNLKEFQMMMSQDLIDRPGNDHLMELIGNRLADHPYKVLEEYYVVTPKKGQDSIPASGTGLNRHTLKFDINAREMYFAFLAPEKADSKFLITLAFAKLSYGWKITNMALGQYTNDGMTGPELYEQAKAEYGKKYLVSAENDMALAETSFSPSPLWVYADTAGSGKFYDDAVNEANKRYRYPIDLTQVSTAPRIIAVTTERDAEWTAPAIWYQTHYNLHGDTNKIKNENVEVQKAVAKLFPGIDKDNKYIKFVAFNEYPSSEKSVDRFEMFEKLK